LFLFKISQYARVVHGNSSRVVIGDW
jgi:hypothetical protein